MSTPKRTGVRFGIDQNGLVGAKHAFQVVLESDYVNRSCFDYTAPVVVPAKTFLSQLV